MSPRIKSPSLATRESFEAFVDEVARSEVSLRALEARRDKRIQAIRDECDPAIAELRARRDNTALGCDKFATDHRDELFTGASKSNETALATYGFRLGNPTLKTLSKITWEHVARILHINRRDEYLRVKTEVAKDLILRDAGKLDLKALGVRVTQSESFYIEPKDQPTA